MHVREVLPHERAARHHRHHQKSHNDSYCTEYRLFKARHNGFHAMLETLSVHIRRLAALLTAGLAFAQPAPQKPPPAVWAPLEFLLGEWVGEGGGAPGQGAGGFSFHPDLQRKILVRKSCAEYPATKDRPAFRHDDLTIVYQQPGTDRLRAVYFDNEGHVIEYAVEVSGDTNTVRFVSEPAASSPRYRLTYRLTGDETVAIQFEISPPGKPDSFSTYLEASARRKP